MVGHKAQRLTAGTAFLQLANARLVRVMGVSALLATRVGRVQAHRLADSEMSLTNRCSQLVVMSIREMRLASDLQSSHSEDHHATTYETVPTRLYRSIIANNTVAFASRCRHCNHRIMGWFGAILKSCDNGRSRNGWPVSWPKWTEVLSTCNSPTSQYH